MRSEERAQKFHTDDVSLPQSWLLLPTGRIAREIFFRPIRNTTQIWVVTRHQYVSFSVVRQKSSRGETSDDAVRCQMFSQINGLLKTDIFTIVSNALKNNLALN